MNLVFDLVDGVWKLVLSVVRPFWRFSQGLASSVLPGQPRIVHQVAAAALVFFELGLVWYMIRTKVYGS